VSRLSWDDYFLNVAEEVSKRSTCDRKFVGCILVVERRIVATGYNGSIRGEPHCDEAGHDLVESIGADGKLAPNCVRTVHAEANAIAQAAAHGVAVAGAIAYVNTFPCWPCFKLLANARVAEVVYRDGYRIDPRVAEASARLGLVIRDGGANAR
jgi:dCMP deaminase